MRFIREVIKSGGGVDISFYDGGDHITASIKSAYLKFPKEEEEVDIITLTPAPGENAETITIVEERVKEKETLF